MQNVLKNGFEQVVNKLNSFTNMALNKRTSNVGKIEYRVKIYIYTHIRIGVFLRTQNMFFCSLPTIIPIIPITARFNPQGA